MVLIINREKGPGFIVQRKKHMIGQWKRYNEYEYKPTCVNELEQSGPLSTEIASNIKVKTTEATTAIEDAGKNERITSNKM